MYFEINVTKHDYHFFATAERSILDHSKMLAVYQALRSAFPSSAGYLITVTQWNKTGTPFIMEQN